MEVAEIKEKMNIAWELLNEVVNETKKLNNTETNKQIAGLFRTFGHDNFIESVNTMRVWIDDLE